ncbi:MAG: hypothetical protein NTV59_06445 [Chloroflexi bacterium]|nr:hypothetical protein [Chloroflexota bacterium]
MSGSIKDRVAIVGMGCTRFGELWNKGPSDLIVDRQHFQRPRWTLRQRAAEVTIHPCFSLCERLCLWT